jgi:hypothetical protein
MAAVEIPAANIVEARGKTGRILIWGWVEYDDIFARVEKTDRHRTEFCTELIVIDWPGRGIQFSDRLHSEYNGSEIECGQRFKDVQRRRPFIAELNVADAADTLGAKLGRG